MPIVAAWITTAVVFAGLDAVWISFTSERLYRAMLTPLLRDGFELAPAIAFYLIYISGLVYLAILPALERSSLTRALVHGAVLGLCAYGTFDLSNQSMLRVWDIRVTLADMAWGTTLSAIAASAGYAVARRFS